MIKNEYCRLVANIAIRSVLFEVSVSPKPGLVDRFNPGAHKDMDIFTFLKVVPSSIHISITAPWLG